MNQYQMITLGISFAVAVCLVGVGVAIAEASTIGIVCCIAAAFVLMGAGFAYKRKQNR